MKKIIFALIFCLAFPFSLQAQTLQASVNRNPIPEGEAFILTLRLENPQNAETPDLKPLEQDFNVYSVSNSSRVNIINGVRSDIRQWDIGLIAKRTGELSVPSLQAGNISSNPLVIKVMRADNLTADTQTQNTPNSANAPRYALKTEVSDKNPYVQQQINYTVTLIDAGGLQGDAPYFVGDGGNDWIVKTIGSPVVESKTINGKTVREIKFRYALFPQKSGKLQLPIVGFRGFYLTQDRIAYDPFADLFGNSVAASGLGFADMFATRNPVNLTSKPEEINVRPIAPDNNGHWWLPAQSVELFSEWKNNQVEFKVGEAVTRTIYLKAVGVAENQLPEIKFPKVNGIKQYPEKQQSESRLDNGRLVSVKKAVNVYIPNQTGQLTLPAIQVPWFNVVSNRMETALLPEVTVNVKASASMAPTSATTLTTEDITPKVSEAEKMVDAISDVYVYLFVGVAFILGILFSFLLLKFRSQEKDETEKKSIRNYQSYIALKAHEADFKSLRDAIIEWGNRVFVEQKINNLKDVVACVDNSDFAAEINKLMKILYSSQSTPTDWNAETFVKTFNSVYKKNKKISADDKPLPDLYK